jgi:pSer/pThr/pTyr-binding forkhead associated (FHA) protein
LSAPDVRGRVWESDTLLRVGRLETLEVVLDHYSVSRRHAEVRLTADGWGVSDLGSTNGTFLNGTRLGPGRWPLKPKDVLRVGEVGFVVDLPGAEISLAAAALKMALSD